MQESRGGGAVLWVKVNHELTEVNYSDYRSPIKCLWVKIRRDISKGDLRPGICYRPPNHDDKDKEALKQSHLSNL